MTNTSANTVRRAADIRKEAAAKAHMERSNAYHDGKKREVCFASAAGDTYRRNQSNH